MLRVTELRSAAERYLKQFDQVPRHSTSSISAHLFARLMYFARLRPCSPGLVALLVQVICKSHLMYDHLSRSGRNEFGQLEHKVNEIALRGSSRY